MKWSVKSKKVQLSQQISTNFHNKCASALLVTRAHITVTAGFCCTASLSSSCVHHLCEPSSDGHSPLLFPPHGWNGNDGLWSCKWCFGWTKLDVTKLTPLLLKLMMLLMLTSQGKLGRLTLPEQELTSCFLGLWTGKLIWAFTTSCCAWKQRAEIRFSENHIFKIMLSKCGFLGKNFFCHIDNFCHTLYLSA